MYIFWSIRSIRITVLLRILGQDRTRTTSNSKSTGGGYQLESSFIPSNTAYLQFALYLLLSRFIICAIRCEASDSIF